MQELARLDRGEAEAIALAHERTLPVILDDGAARAVARRLRLDFAGSAGLAVRAKRQDLVEDARSVIDALMGAGLRLDERAYAELLLQAGEAD